MTLSISNIRDMLADDQEDLVKATSACFRVLLHKKTGRLRN